MFTLRRSERSRSTDPGVQLRPLRALAAIQRTRLSAICLVPTRVLLDQWLREIGALYRGPVGCYGDGVRRWAPLTVATYESAYRHMDRIGDRFGLVVIDEVHHFGVGMRDEALEMTTAGARLGLTATPPRNSDVLARLGRIVGPTVFELTVADLAGGFLASFDAITLHLELSPDERSAYSSLHGRFSAVHREFCRLAPMASWPDCNSLMKWRQSAGALARIASSWSRRLVRAAGVRTTAGVSVGRSVVASHDPFLRDTAVSWPGGWI